MTYPHVLIICKDCMVKGYLYEILKGKNTFEEIMETLEIFRLHHAGHQITIVDYNDVWYEMNYERIKNVEDR